MVLNSFLMILSGLLRGLGDFLTVFGNASWIIVGESRMVKNCQEVKFLAIRHTSCSNSYSGTGPLVSSRDYPPDKNYIISGNYYITLELENVVKYIELWPLNLTATVNNFASKFISFLPNSISLYDIRCLITGQNRNFEPKFSDLDPHIWCITYERCTRGICHPKNPSLEIFLHEKSTLPTKLH